MKKSAPPLRGAAELGYMQSAKLEGNTIVTTFQVKNMSVSNALVGLQITEFWYDKAGQRASAAARRRHHCPEVAEGAGHDDAPVQIRAEQRDRQAGEAEGGEGGTEYVDVRR
jgi:hypothetical protein